MIELVALLVRANLAAGLVILLVAVLRKPARDWCGAEVAYGLWLAPLVAALACLAPARTLSVPAQAIGPSPVADPFTALLGSQGPAELLAGLWAAGLMVMLARLGWSQARFLRQARLGLAGPAVSGLVRPRLVVPDDYETRFTAEERRIIRAHERMHVDRRDLAANALVAAVQTLCWFNPLVHWAARLMRHDQELACDAAVIARMPGLRRLYAETLLKTQLAPNPPPLGCHWPALGQHPLEERIGLLRQTSPQVRRYIAGSLSVLVLTLAVGGGAWAVKPANLAPLPAAKPAPAQSHVMSFMLYRNGWPGI